jgi:hypothetical protein
MKGFDSYMGGYLDRRMKLLIDEWDLATRGDLKDFYSRLRVLEDEARSCAGFEATAGAKMTELEKRIQYLKEKSK